MAATTTHTATFTISNARYIASKVKTDLKLLQRIYGSPSDSGIEDYGEEAALLLRDGYLGTVTYGYRRNGNWILALRYVAQSNGTLAQDDRAGKVSRGINIIGASFSSYLTYSTKWETLTQAEKQAVKAKLPVKRQTADPPGTSGGYWSADNTYSSKGNGVKRSTFRLL